MKISVTSGRPRQCARAARRCRAVRWASAAAWTLLAATAQGQGAEGSAAPEATQGQDVTGLTTPDAAALDAQLEQAGATIRAINVTVDNVFDPSNPKEDKALYRWANKVHVRTHDSVIESALLFRRRRSLRGSRARRVGSRAARARLSRGREDRSRKLRPRCEHGGRRRARPRLVDARAGAQVLASRRPERVGHRPRRPQPVRHGQAGPDH